MVQTSSAAARTPKLKSSSACSNLRGDRGAAVPCSELRKEKPHQESPESKASRLGRERVIAEIKDKIGKLRSCRDKFRESVMSAADTTAASSESGGGRRH
jgi:hypothetical protein